MQVRRCNGCGTDITPEDIVAGGPVKVQDKFFCGACAEKIRQKRAQAAAAAGSGTATAAGAKKTAAPKRAGTAKRTAPGRPGTARRTKTAMRKRPGTAARRRPRRDEEDDEDYYDEPEKSNTPLILGIGGGGLALLLIIVLVVVMSGGGGDESAFEEEYDRPDTTQNVQNQQNNRFQREDDAAAEWRRLQDEIERLKAQGRYGEAMAKLNAFMQKWGGTPAAREAASMRDDIEKIKADYEVFEPFKRRAENALSSNDPVAAMRAYSEFGRENPQNYFLSNAANGYRKAGQRLPKQTGMTIPVFSGFDASFLGLAGWYVDGSEIQCEGPGTVWSELPRTEQWLDYTVSMEVMVSSGNPQFMVRGVWTRREGARGLEGAWKAMTEDILPHGSYVNFELKVSGESWTITVDGTEKDSAVLPSEHSHSGTAAFRFEGEGSMRIKKLEVTINKYD